MFIDQLAEAFFLYAIYSGFILFLLLPLSTLGLAICMPKSLMDRYIKEPHFSDLQVHLFNEYPGKMACAVVMAWVICFPERLGAYRKMTDIRDHAPRWFQIYSQVLTKFIVLGWGCSAMLSIVVCNIFDGVCACSLGVGAALVLSTAVCSSFMRSAILPLPLNLAIR
ncbi:MAG: hypothetical protein HC848_00620 [Limnobacter sp.]|nr:hypothetical protein [Limnobacter sp.]